MKSKSTHGHSEMRPGRRFAARRALGAAGCVGIALGAAAWLTAVRVSGSTASLVARLRTPYAARLEAQGELARAWNALSEAPQGSLDTSSPPDHNLDRAAVRVLVRQGRDAEALEQLQRSPGIFDSSEEMLLRAALALRSDKPQQSLDLLSSHGAIPAGLDGYAHWLEAEASAATGAWEHVRVAAEAALPDSLPVEMRLRLMLLRAQAANGSGDHDTLRRIAPELGPAARRDDASGLLLVKLARSCLSGVDADLARTWAAQLLEARPTPAESAYALLLGIEKRSRAGLDFDMSLGVARFETRTGRHAEARRRLGRLLAGTGPSRASRAEAGLALADSYQKSGDLGLCLSTLRRAAADAAGTPFEPDVLVQRGRALRMLGRTDEAIARYRDVAQRFPGHASADDALYEVGWRYEVQGRFEEAQRAYARCVTQFPRGTLADDAMLREGLCAFRDARPSDAAARFRQLASRFPDSPLVDNAIYWNMLAQQRLGDAPGTLALRDRLEHEFPRSYFTVLARRRVEQGLVLQGPLWPAAEPPHAGAGNPSFETATETAMRCQAAYEAAVGTLRQVGGLQAPIPFEGEVRLWRFLLDHGLALEASWEARRLEHRFDGDPGALLEILDASERHGAHERLVRLAVRIGQLVTDPSLHDALEVLLYPAPWSATLAEQSLRHHLSHALILGLVRQESAFDMRADSRAGARGLMQLMPQVGRRLAPRIGRFGFDPDDLYDPQVNVALGCQLLEEELRAAGGKVPQALAAYNAGSDLAARWYSRLRPHDPPEMYLDLVEYQETRTYLQQVLGNAEVYRRVYALQ